VILYAANWTQPKPGLEPQLVSITPEDIQGLMEVMHGIPEGDVDLIIHSPGGSAEAAESVVSYLRSKFRDIRVFVPHAAMSAATMLACASDRIIMGKHSFFGPIDPQFVLQTELGRMSVPAYAILEQFELAKKECAGNPAVLSAWMPMLRQYGPALIVQCKLARQLAETLVSSWLSKWMLAADSAKASSAASQLADHGTFRSHSRFIDRAQAKALGLIVDDLEADQQLQDAVLSVFHATTHTFSGPCVKIIENHLGKAFVKNQQAQIVRVQAPISPFQQPPPVQQ
jgi:Serine dehydrogenase proteinase